MIILLNLYITVNFKMDEIKIKDDSTASKPKYFGFLHKIRSKNRNKRASMQKTQETSIIQFLQNNIEMMIK